MSAEVGLTASEVEDFAPAFEHSEMDQARAIFGVESCIADNTWPPVMSGR